MRFGFKWHFFFHSIEFSFLFYYAGCFGTFAPFFLASLNPIAIACLRLVTFLPLRPERNVPFFLRFIALCTVSCAFLEYLAMIFFLKIYIKKLYHRDSLFAAH